MTTKIELKIKHRFSGEVMFTAEVDASLSPLRRLGMAVRLAVSAKAYLRGAYLRGADLRGADLSGANDIIDCGTPYHWRVVVQRNDDGVRIIAGCRSFTLEGALEHWSNHDEDRRLMLPLLEYVKAALAIKGWSTTPTEKAEAAE